MGKDHEALADVQRSIDLSRMHGILMCSSFGKNAPAIRGIDRATPCGMDRHCAEQAAKIFGQGHAGRKEF